MKKIMNFVLMAVLAVCFVLPAAGKAEAAKLAVVPLANHVEDNTTASMITWKRSWIRLSFLSLI